VATVTLANKNARIIWALLTRGDQYRPAILDQSSMPRRAGQLAGNDPLRSEFKRT
jgi:hypothetical protein